MRDLWMEHKAQERHDIGEIMLKAGYEPLQYKDPEDFFPRSIKIDRVIVDFLSDKLSFEEALTAAKKVGKAVDQSLMSFSGKLVMS